MSQLAVSLCGRVGGSKNGLSWFNPIKGSKIVTKIEVSSFPKKNFLGYKPSDKSLKNGKNPKGGTLDNKYLFNYFLRFCPK